MFCVDPVAYGAVPDDGKPDTAAIQQAIDEAERHDHGAVCLGAGVWEIDKPKGHASLVVTGAVALAGIGPRSIVRMTGSSQRHDWYGIELRGAHDVVLRDFTIDGLGAYDTDEQTHLIQISPGAHDIALGHMVLGPMRRADQKIGQGIGGDCVRMLGEAGREVRDVVIAESTFVDCDRSGVGFQRALEDITIAHDRITGAGDQSIDFEPTGSGAIEDVALVDLEIHRPMAAQGAWALTIAGIGKDGASRVLLARSVLDGGGIGMLNVSDIEIVDNQITHGPGNAPTLNLIRRADKIHIARNHIVRPAGSPPGLVIHAEHNNGHVPHGLVVEDNTIEQDTAASIVAAVSVGGLVIRHNVIDYHGTNESLPVLVVSAVFADIDGIDVEDNTVHGKTGTLLVASPRNHRISEPKLHGNTVDDVVQPR